jgi:hypothetical protein
VPEKAELSDDSAVAEAEVMSVEVV